MKKELYFKPTPLYKEYMILDLVEKNTNITQRELSKNIGASVSMINAYLDEYEEKGFIIRKYISDKKIDYIITKKGIERKRILNIGYLKASHKIHKDAKENIRRYMIQLYEQGFQNLILYGAGEIAELLLLVVTEDEFVPIKILGVIDDDKKKQGKHLNSFPIISYEKIKELDHDAILISNYKNRKNIYENLLSLGYEKEKILMFIEM